MISGDPGKAGPAGGRPHPMMGDAGADRAAEPVRDGTDRRYLTGHEQAMGQQEAAGELQAGGTRPSANALAQARGL
jgi:hypothetical protein